MLLRRVIEHVKAQNWTAVALDFFIVVVGVFIGIQVANWNDTQNNKAGLVASLERLDKEVSHNIALIDKVLTSYESGQDDRNKGREALNACSYSPEAQTALENLLFDFVGDIQPNFVSVALDQLASEGRYQDLLSAQFQQEFANYAGRLKEEHEQLTNHYDKMWLYHVNFHPAVSAIFPGGNEEANGDWGFKLDKSFVEVCNDASFRTRFINTIGFYSSINRRLTSLKAEAALFQASLADEMDSH